ncbi:Stress-induced protein KIN2 [Spatholobus suberectus]|nr:Stress-induced protein KIN2 [Spatholobus suberectus]
MDPQKMSYEAGQAQGQVQGQAQEKTNNLMDMASNAAQSAKETVTEAGQQVMATAQGAADAVKNAAGMNKK